MAVKAPQPFSAELPTVPVFKNGIVHYCHNQKELDKWTKPEDEGGPGYVMQYTHQEYPKLMSHPNPAIPDRKVNSKEEQKKAEKEGFNFDHFENNQAATQSKAEGGAAAPSFDPKAQARMDALEKQNAELVKKMDDLLAALGEKGKPQI